MADPVADELARALRYLGEIGFRDVYLRPARPCDADVAPAALDERQASLTALATQAEACQACRLAESRQRVVFGSGSPVARLMLVGEAPGAEEDRQGLPFVGAAGELLTRMLKAIDLDRDQVYIANILKCRPPGNRDPLPDEVAACRHFLDAQIAAVQPQVLLALGRVAAQVLLANDLPLGRQRGSWYRLGDVDMLVTYHPAALLRNAALRRPTWEDLQKVRDRLRELGP